MKYYIINNGNLMRADNQNALADYGLPIMELPEDYEYGKYIVVDNELVLNPNWEEEQAQKRQAQFEHEFFNVQGYGWYRRVPKGYSSAVESMNTLFNVANIAQGVQAGLIIFYPTPDFDIPEQCTEEWLVEHQIVMPAMTKEEFMQLYVVFMTAWNTQEHVSEVE